MSQENLIQQQQQQQNHQSNQHQQQLTPVVTNNQPQQIQFVSQPGGQQNGSKLEQNQEGLYQSHQQQHLAQNPNETQNIIKNSSQIKILSSPTNTAIQNPTQLQQQQINSSNNQNSKPNVVSTSTNNTNNNTSSHESEHTTDEEDEEENEVVEESSDGRWSKRNDPVSQRDVPGIDYAFLAMDTEYGFEVVWNEIKLSGGKKFKKENLLDYEVRIK
jgi:hypothetical protein